MCPVLDQIHHLETVLEDLSEGDRDMIFRRTAAHIYDIPLAIGDELQTRNRETSGATGRT
jgi:hypothetical protein